ncbi:MAG: hypothetical protein E7403_01845 [Ruminococcaceae bacterium]|nr:hypothetical protein [Oscillospiraceae bacterium]
MKRIILLIVTVIFLLSGCTFETSTEKIEKQEEKVESSQQSENNIDIEISELYGVWKSSNGAPLILNSDGTVESTAVKSKGTYTLKGNELVIYWTEYDKNETYRVEENNGVISIIYGSEPTVYVYNKE